MGYVSKMGGAIAAAGVVLLAGCSSIGPGAGSAPAPIGASTAPVGGECNAQGAQVVVGKNATAKVVEDARVRSGARLARVLRPGQIITKEFDGQRLNLEVDASGKIVAVRCG